MKSYKNLYVYGDSFSTKDVCVAPEESFWGLLASDIDAEMIYNYSFSGNAFESIVHNLVLNASDITADDSLIIIGIPALHRYVYVSTNGNKRSADMVDTMHWKEGYNKRFGVTGMTSLATDSALFKLYPKLLDTTLGDTMLWEQTRVLRELYLLKELLQNLNLNFMIVNLTVGFNTTKTGFNDMLIDYFATQDNQIIFNNTLHDINHGVNKPVDYDKYGWIGHHGKDGNMNFYNNALKPQMIEAGLL